MEDRQIAPINDWPVPACIAQLESFLGLASCYRIFLNKFAYQTTQLYVCTANNSTVWWCQKHLVESNNLQRALASALVLAVCYLECDYILHTDVSDMAIGTILAEKAFCGPEGPLPESLQCFCCWSVQDIETHYSACDHKMSAINNNLIYWKPTIAINIRQYTCTKCRCSIARASTNFAAANGDTWINYNRCTVQSSTSQQQPIW